MPNFGRVILRFFFNGEERARRLILNVHRLEEQEASLFLRHVFNSFSRRHRNLADAFADHFGRIAYLLPSLELDIADFSEEKQMLLGSYFTMEYSVESAALVNPSIVSSPDQLELPAGAHRVILSLRAIGEGHISSIVFRKAILTADGGVILEEEGDLTEDADVILHHTIRKEDLVDELDKLGVDTEVYTPLLQPFGAEFRYEELYRHASREIAARENPDERRPYFEILHATGAYHEIKFSLNTAASERVIFPATEQDSRGMEDARFVTFTNDDGRRIYYATYTAYNGLFIHPYLLRTEDFYRFTFHPLYGDGARNKNLALFPRKINGRYYMLARVDGVNNYIMDSDRLHFWENPRQLDERTEPWEMVQAGNCGSPIETEYGWLVVTHGVGSIRRYCLGAMLLDLEDPSRVIGKLREPLLIPNRDEREGYVPNVLYSCGNILHGDRLVIPYGLSDYATSFATVELSVLLEALRNQG